MLKLRKSLNRHLQKLIMRCQKAFVGAQGIAPLSHFWKSPNG
jgi:hypothetical protein